MIASISFHPVEKYVVIATYNEVLFWDWEKEEPEIKVGQFNYLFRMINGFS